ncbi:cyclin-dependent kinase 4 inhibitor C [Lates calcarifer]|uniref:Cyclin-dependent kinase 4 inhibitor C n=2 Tax=Lates calcarifer TaxID=8187 RepID=A0AAJ7LQL8_LATCA|nr:cyclin-dependent kinase 4 inhibitor C [Lates calcarifer]XP_018528860.1 cyclin-dependent kinase 4 inhibitor C [Lates calcarifer]
MDDKSLTDKLCNASASGKLSEVLALLQNGADVNGFNTYKRTALQVVMLGSTLVAEALLDAGANPNLRDPTCGLTVTHDAAREGFVDTVRVLISHGADVNLVDKQGNMPLHLAAREGHLQVVQVLIGPTADPQRANGQGYTAEQLALHFGRMDIARYIDDHLNSR